MQPTKQRLSFWPPHVHRGTSARAFTRMHRHTHAHTKIYIQNYQLAESKKNKQNLRNANQCSNIGTPAVSKDERGIKRIKAEVGNMAWRVKVLKTGEPIPGLHMLEEGNRPPESSTRMLCHRLTQAHPQTNRKVHFKWLKKYSRLVE